MPSAPRSYLSVPASNERMIVKALQSSADTVFLDLEDAVAPPAKEEARAGVIEAMRTADWRRRARSFRMNGLDTPWFYRDVIDVVEGSGGRVDLIIVPKVERPEDLITVDTLLTAIERRIGGNLGRIVLQAQIESAKGLVNAERIAMSSSRLRALVYGPGDFAASVGMPMASIGAMDEWDASYPGHRFHYAMSKIVVAARAAGLEVVDGPMADYRDLDALRTSCRLARGLGFDGKWCIHPGQIEIVNTAFSPSEAEVAWAARVVEAYAEAAGAINIDGRMVDEASVKLARRILDRQLP